MGHGRHSFKSDISLQKQEEVNGRSGASEEK